ncbi:MAG TPA: hypothetical protein VFQ43_02675, partial [Nitrososphaera sp.]|nr:hypothetical protein [Nitrososphaera sp.]
TNTLENRKLTNVIDRWIELTQRDGEKKGKIQAIPADDPRVQKLLSGLSLTERDQVDTLMQQRLMSTQHMQNQILEKGLQISSTRGGSLLQKMVGGKLNVNVSLASDLLNAFTADRSDPIAARTADMTMTQVQNQLTPEAFHDLAKFTENAAAEWTKYKEWFQENPDWASAQRYGQFIAEFKRGGKTYVVGVDNRKEAESLAKGAPLTSFKKNQQDDPDKPPYLGLDAVGTINFLREKQQTQIDILRNRGVISDQEGVEMLKRYSPVEQLATEETYRRGALGLTPQPRRLTKLSEEHPWLQNHFSWVSKTANYWSRQLLREQVKAHLLDPEIAQNKELSNLIRDHYDNMLKPDSATGRFMQKAASTWFMGLNLATAMVNGTQPFLTHVAEFTSMTGKPLDSYRRVLSALGEAVSGGLRHTWKTSDHEWLMERAANDGIRDLAMHDDQAAVQETLSTNFKRAMQRNKVQTTGQRLGTMAGTFSNVALWPFRQVERLNNDAALLASFDYYRESQPNLSRDEAYAKAKDFNSAVNYGGGAAQRSIGLYKGVPRTLAMLSTAMQSYTLGSSFQLARYIRAGLFRPDGLTPHEVYSARKAGVQMLGTQCALAGVLGLPFVSSAIAALDKAFPDLEVNKHLREWMHQIAGEDGENGNVLTDIGMTGIPSMMGWDVQSRLS